MRRIIMESDKRREVRELFGVSDRMMSHALNYTRDTELARKIRATALQKGGRVVGDELRLETQFASNGDMMQNWGDRAKLVAEKRTGKVRVFIDGELDREYSDISVKELMQEQHRIGVLVNSR